MRSIKVKSHKKYVRAIFITQKEKDLLGLIGYSSHRSRVEALEKLFNDSSIKDKITTEEINDLSYALGAIFFSVGNDHNDPDNEDMAKYQMQYEE